MQVVADEPEEGAELQDAVGAQRLEEVAHCRLGSGLRDAERWSLAQALSRDGFDGFILCEVCNGRTRAESLLATARVLLRNLDQLDWESYH